MAPSVYDIDNSAAKAAVLVAPNGTPLTMDSTDRQRVSLYGKNAAAGDSPVELLTPFSAFGTPKLLPFALGSDNNGWANYGRMAPTSDGLARQLGLYTIGMPMLWNGASLDQSRNNVDLTLLASAARTTQTASPDQVNYNGRGVLIYFNITGVPGVDTVQLWFQTKDPVSGGYPNAITMPAVSAAGLYTYQIYPGASAGATVTSSAALPRVWRVSIVHSAGTSFTYSVGASNIL